MACLTCIARSCWDLVCFVCLLLYVRLRWGWLPCFSSLLSIISWILDVLRLKQAWTVRVGVRVTASYLSCDKMCTSVGTVWSTVCLIRVWHVLMMWRAGYHGVGVWRLLHRIERRVRLVRSELRSPDAIHGIQGDRRQLQPRDGEIWKYRWARHHLHCSCQSCGIHVIFEKLCWASGKYNAYIVGPPIDTHMMHDTSVPWVWRITVFCKNNLQFEVSWE